ncbi:MAG: hypothetical protein N2C12_00735 [Planctomycetales bacterium]
MIPVIPDQGGVGAHGVIQDYGYAVIHESISSFGTKCLLFHITFTTFGALLIAVMFGQRDLSQPRAEAVFPLRSILWLTASMATVFALIRILNSSPVLYIVVLVPWSGRFVRVFIEAWPVQQARG